VQNHRISQRIREHAWFCKTKSLKERLRAAWSTMYGDLGEAEGKAEGE